MRANDAYGSWTKRPPSGGPAAQGGEAPADAFTLNRLDAVNLNHLRLPGGSAGL